MKNIAIFILACLISTGSVFFSKTIAAPELGISTILLVWGMASWYFINRQNSTIEDE
ncbi:MULTISPECIES: hypothetical protein [unclassified Pedobacter]|jgi:hypothetical protein|uniref:hypothetical protein n=1 Tax=Pedobacter TaxID=84567 RepID=UPI002245CD75|nr:MULTISPECIES: hypothetical protein [unclassified Pedobacter]MCX2430022.1 hypothetical protein [Pedobacter sp. GR22-10]MCX2586289.1 hypothetical protein [Pedobacter sp. MR22-3]